MQLLDSLASLDEGIFRALNLAGTNQVMDDLMLVFTFFGISYVIVLISLPLWLKSRRELAFDVAILVIVASVVAELLKIIVDRPRPSEELSNVHMIVGASGASFPSAHATRAFAVAMILAFRTRPSIGMTANATAFLIAVSRVYLGVHWPSDILAGALLGVSLAWLIKYLGDRDSLYRRLRSIIIGRVAGLHNRSRR